MKLDVTSLFEYAFGNHILRLSLSVAVKLNFRPYIRRYTSTNKNFEYSYPLSGLSILFMALFHSQTRHHIIKNVY